MNKAGVRCRVLGIRKILFPIFIFSSLFLHPSSLLFAQHTRLYACAIGSDSVGASMGGSSLGAGLWQSDDTAKTWKQLGWKHVKCYSVDVVNNSNGKIIYEACGNGVMRSTDAGANWRMLTDWRITEVMDIAIDQKAPKNIYIATAQAIWKSMDGGDSWFEADTDIPYPIFVSRIKIDPKDHLKIYAATETKIYNSGDGGLQWVKINADSSALHNFIIDDTEMIAVFDDFKSGNKRPLLEFPKNINATLRLGSEVLIGSLDGGIWAYDYLNAHELPVRIGLDSEQIWRLKAVEVK